MHKKIFILTLVVSILCFSSVCFANNMMQDVKDMGTNVMNNIGNAMDNIGDSMSNGAQNAGDELNQSGNKIGSEMNNMNQGATEDNNNDSNTMVGTTDNNNGGYTTTQTAVTTAMGNSNFWTWAILILASIGIISLIWYYSSQNKEEHNRY